MAIILVVDDQADTRDLLTQMLRFQPYHVLTAANGHEAVLMTRATHPTLVLMDLSMPVLDGWAATAAIKATPAVAHIPIVAVTGHGAGSAQDRALKAGCSAYLEKPIDFAGLMTLLARFV